MSFDKGEGPALHWARERDASEGSLDVSATDEKRDALQVLAGLESGGMSSADAAVIAEDLDPVLIYVIVTFLREVYPASDPAASSVLERVVQMTSRSPTLIRKHKEGEQDPVSRWFESEYSYHDFRGRGPELVEMIADKLES